MGEWVKLSEKEPADQEFVLVGDFSGRRYGACKQNPTVACYGDWYDDGNMSWDDGDGGDIHLKEVTHWMPMPKRPEAP